jgi:hypothetical protein
LAFHYLAGTVVDSHDRELLVINAYWHFIILQGSC